MTSQRPDQVCTEALHKNSRAALTWDLVYLLFIFPLLNVSGDVLPSLLLKYAWHVTLLKLPEQSYVWNPLPFREAESHSLNIVSQPFFLSSLNKLSIHKCLFQIIILCIQQLANSGQSEKL